ncbi:nestin [Phyllostomus hastatus]|uniref:nestin n=1 Tax=Phyllostomus hastatus TaxID=9423 RepID=UPI001E67FC90|nr:nestin [Phyllostomus hastatus]
MEGCLGEESFQMWELNRRLEAYLARVKALEERYELLSTELDGLRAQSRDTSWRARADDELAALRALVDQRWREKHAAEVARDSLQEEVESVAGRCQQQRLARDRMAEEVAHSRRAVEAEKCAQAWLRSRVAELERELEALRAAHEEERASLVLPAAGPPCRPSPTLGPPGPGPEVGELARRLGEAWRGAVSGYQERVAHMETALGQARQRLGSVVQAARKGRLELQQLQTERSGLQDRRAALVQRLEGCWQERLRATEKFQLAVEALEQEKQDLQTQIAQVLEGRQQLSRLKMSLSLEVATYRTLLEAENSRLQVPGCGSKSSFSIQDPKLELHFPGTPEGRCLGPLLSVLSPTPLSSPLPDTLETPVPAFLKSQEFLQAHTPTLASTPILPTPQAPCPATDGEIRTQDAPLSVLQPQVGRQVPQATEPDANIAITASILPGLEESVEKQQGASTGQSPKDDASLAPPFTPNHPRLEAIDGEPSETRVSSRFQEEGEGQMWELAEKEIATEVKVLSSLQQQTQQEEGDLDMREIQDSQGPLEKETLKYLEEEIQEPLMLLEEHSHETLRSLEKENQELLKSLEEKDMEVVRTLEKETVELLKPIGKEDPQPLQSLEKENQELMRSSEGNLETFLYSGEENQELVRSLEGENFESLRALEKQIQEPLRSLEEEDPKILRTLEKENPSPLKSLEEENQETWKPLEKENQEPLKSLEQEDQETMRPLEKETQQLLKSLGEEDQMTLRPLEKVKPEPLKSPGKDQEIFRPFEKENQELLISLQGESVEAIRCLETENLEPLKSAGEDLEILNSTGTQEPLCSLEEKNQEIIKPLEKEIQKPLGSVEENQESSKPLEKENQESLRSLGNLRTPEEVDKESERFLQEEESLEKGESQESLRSLEEEGQELLLSANQQRWEDMMVGDQKLDQEMPSGRGRVGIEDEAELAPRERDGFSGKEELAEEGELQLPSPATAGGWSTGEGHSGSPEPKEQRVLAEGTSGEGGAEGLLDPEGQLEPRGAPGLQAPCGMSEVIEPVLESDDKAPEGGQAPPEVTLNLETARGEFTSGAEQGLEQKVVELEDPGHLAREEVMEPLLGEEGLEAKKEQDLEGSGKDLQGAAALEPELPMLLRKNRDPLESHGAGKELEPQAPWEAKEVFPAETLPCDESDTPQSRPLGSEEAEKDVEPVLGPSSSRPTESCLLTLVPEDAPGPQPLAKGSPEASWKLEGSALEKVEGEKEELRPGELPEGLQDDGEESRDESEADELGETLPDSTPLGVYLRSPASPKWDLAEEQRPSSQGETRKEGWDPAVLTPEGHGAHPEEEEEEEGGEEEEECGQDSDLSEEFEDVGTEGSIPPGVARELMEPLGQVSQLLPEPAAWGQDGESDGFADEEESGEEGEEEEEGKGPGVEQWGPGSSVGSLPAGSGLQSGNLPGSGTVSVSIPWDDGLRGAAADLPMTVLETESQDSTEPSGSEEESAPLEREDQVSGPLGTLSGTEYTPGVNGQGPSLKKELEHVNGGLVNQLEQSDRAGQGKLEALEGDGGSPLEEEERGALKTPWAGAPLHLGPGQLLKFTQREGDGDSWSSGED